jgi:Rrf2 family transcriptional regulator, iron-sulfur cluster assembly transcription factor
MFQLSRRTDYAMRILIELGLAEKELCVPARELARRTAVSQHFLHKITTDLVKASIVRTYAGPAGGLALARLAGDITVLQLVEAVEGPICLNVCLIRPRECPRDLTCPAHRFWGHLQSQIIQIMQATTLADLVNEAFQLKQNSPCACNVSYLLTNELSAPRISGVMEK